MHRTQLYLDDDMHARLSEMARKQGRTLSELVRDALERTYGRAGIEEKIATLRAAAGIWKNRKDLPGTAEFVRSLRKDTHRVRGRGK